MDLSHIIKKFGEPLSHEPNSSGEIRFMCPQCHKRGFHRGNFQYFEHDLGYHLYYNVYKKVWFCQRCGYSGSPRKDIESSVVLTPLDVLEAEIKELDKSHIPPRKLIIGEEYDVKRHTSHPSSMKVKSVPLPEDSVPLTPQSGWHYSYAISRGISPEDIERYHIMVSNDPHPMIIFPIVMPSFSAWVGRHIAESSAIRYKNASGDWRRYAIFNYRPDLKLPVIICEGPISAIVAGPNAVATLGIQFTDHQVDLLCDLDAPEYVVAYDGGEEVQSIKLANALLGRGKNVRFAVFPMGKDPADLGRELTLQYLEESEPYTVFSDLSRKLGEAYV